MNKERKLGLIAFMNHGGLGAQTRRLAKMLKPELIMVIDSAGFSPNKEQNYSWYNDFKIFITGGFPNNEQVKKFLPNLTHVLTCENPYNFNIVWYGQKQGTKVYCQSNYEFCENLDKPYLPVPEFLMPSYWRIDEMKSKFGQDKVQYLPPPIDPHEFAKARAVNLTRTGLPRFLHIIGTVATLDRNGTLDLLKAVKKSYSTFELVIRTQHPLPMEYFLDDKRVIYEIDNKSDNNDLYEGFDALILPRRYGGLSLTTNEALMSALPVIMTNISPNDELLPKKWLVESKLKGSFEARSMINYYSARQIQLTDKIDWLCKQDFSVLKKEAFKIAMDNFSTKVLKPKYDAIFS